MLLSYRAARGRNQYLPNHQIPRWQFFEIFIFIWFLLEKKKKKVKSQNSKRYFITGTASFAFTKVANMKEHYSQCYIACR